MGYRTQYLTYLWIYSSHENLWKCEKCTNIQQNCMSDSTNWELPGPTKSLPSQPVPSTTSNKLKIYQWNAEGIGPKLFELRDRLLNSDTNVLAVQESKLRKTDKTKLHPSKVTRQSERTKQHSWWRSPTLHPNGHRVWEATLLWKSWYGDSIYSYQSY